MIVGWRVTGHMRTTMVLDAIEMARWSRGNTLPGLTCHSDAGSRFTSIRYGERLAEIGAVPSIGTGQSFDNALAETVNGYYKSELIYGPARTGPWKTMEDVELATLNWVHWHNTSRLHGYLNDIPPAEFEAIFYATKRTDQPRSKSNSPSLHQNQDASMSCQGVAGDRMCCGEGAVQLSGEVALQRAHDLLGGAAFGPTSGNVGPCGCVGAHPDDDHGGQRSVESAVAAPIESVPHGVSRGCRYRAGACQRRERCFGAPPPSAKWTDPGKSTPHGGQAIHESHQTRTATPILSASTGPAMQRLKGDSHCQKLLCYAVSPICRSMPSGSRITLSTVRLSESCALAG